MKRSLIKKYVVKMAEQKEEAIINDCKYLELDETCNDFYKFEDPRLHFDCSLSGCGVNHKCIFPHYVKDPKCCVGYTSGGEEKVNIAKKQLEKYYKEHFGFEPEGIVKFLRGKPDILIEELS